MALLNASGQYQLGDMLISHVAILLITKSIVPEIDLTLGYALIIDAIFGRPLIKLFAKAKKIVAVPRTRLCEYKCLKNAFNFQT